MIFSVEEHKWMMVIVMGDSDGCYQLDRIVTRPETVCWLNNELFT